MDINQLAAAIAEEGTDGHHSVRIYFDGDGSFEYVTYPEGLEPTLETLTEEFQGLTRGPAFSLGDFEDNSATEIADAIQCGIEAL